MKRLRLLSIVLLVMVATVVQAQQQNYLTVSGNKLYDIRGQQVRLTGLNWFGFETSNLVLHGLWARDMKSMLQEIKDLGFNTLRVPWCNDMLVTGAAPQSVQINAFGADPYTGNPLNTYLEGLSPIEIMDVLVDWCQENDIKIVLDNHSRAAGAFLNEGLWYTDAYPEEKWIEDWIFMAQRYKGKSAVVAMDLNNEPHDASWGSGDLATDWDKAAARCGNAILEVNPEVLIMVEGVGTVEGDSYWWGGNLKNAGRHPVALNDASKLVYSAHEYGPEVFNQSWFRAPGFPNNMPRIWNRYFNNLFTQQVSPILLGEFGIKEQDAFSGVSFEWISTFMQFMGDKYSWTFWCWNPNSGDTGGIVKNDWFTKEQWKLDLLTPYQAAPIPNVVDEEGNIPPKVLAKASTLSGIAPLVVDFEATAAVDPEGQPLKLRWEFRDGTPRQGGKKVRHVFRKPGRYAVVLFAIDDKGAIGRVKVPIIVKKESSGNTNPCAFGVPRDSSLPSTNEEYTQFYVLGEDTAGPDLSNIDKLSFNWDGSNRSLSQLAITTTNGQPAWWQDMRSAIDQQLGQINPSMNIADSGFPGLDGDYWVTLDEDNLVLVSQDKDYTIYCTKEAGRPDCESATQRTMVDSPDENVQSVYPNPSKGLFTLQLVDEEIVSIRLMTLSGSVLKYLDINSLESGNLQFGKCLRAGVYLLEINHAEKDTEVIRILKQ